jgi:antitoxin (DNA-binding transcriptional repressor) of toxin-antitoxin stability system
MIRAGIKEVKNNLSRLLARVKAGEVILITDRGRPVARIVREGGEESSVREALGPLVQKGLLIMPGRDIPREDLRAVDVPGRLVSDLVIEDRR